jgi:hypothetical protein
MAAGYGTPVNSITVRLRRCQVWSSGCAVPDLDEECFDALHMATLEQGLRGETAKLVTRFGEPLQNSIVVAVNVLQQRDNERDLLAPRRFDLEARETHIDARHRGKSRWGEPGFQFGL